jgi:hypothetical protein
MDDDCDGVIDDGAAQDDCRTTLGGHATCSSGKCTCDLTKYTNCTLSSSSSNACADLQNDGNDCGTCSHYCQYPGGGGCSAGLCQPYSAYDALPGHILQGLAIDPTTGYMYWGETETADEWTAAYRCQPSSEGGCISTPEPVWIPDAPPANMQITRGRVYSIALVPGGKTMFVVDEPTFDMAYADSGMLFNCPTSGTCPKSPPVLAMSGYGVAQYGDVVTDGTRPFWVDRQAQSLDTLSTTGAVAVLQSNNGLMMPDRMVAQMAVSADNTTLFWANARTQATAGAGIFMCQTSNCTGTITNNVPPPANGNPNFTAVAVAGSAGVYTVVWGVAPNAGLPGGIFSCHAPTCQPTELVADTAPSSLILDARNAYWVGGLNSDEIHACPLTGCMTPMVLAKKQGKVHFLAQNGTTLFWISNASIMRVAKP